MLSMPEVSPSWQVLSVSLRCLSNNKCFIRYGPASCKEAALEVKNRVGIVKLRLGSGTQAQSGSNSGSVTQAQ